MNQKFKDLVRNTKLIFKGHKILYEIEYENSIKFLPITQLYKFKDHVKNTKLMFKGHKSLYEIEYENSIKRQPIYHIFNLNTILEEYKIHTERIFKLYSNTTFKVNVSDVAGLLHTNKFFNIQECFEKFANSIDSTFKILYNNIVVPINIVKKAVNLPPGKVGKKMVKQIIDDNILDTSEEVKEIIADKTIAKINKDFGVKNEEKCIPKNVKKHIRFCEDIGKNIKLKGVVDYIDGDNIIVDVKNRVNKLFEKLYEHEKVQLQLYMHISHIHKARIEEHHLGKKNIIIVDYDQTYVDMIINKICTYCDNVYRFILNDELRMEYVNSNDKKAFIIFHINVD